MNFDEIYNKAIKLTEGNPVDKDALGNSVFEYSAINELPNELFIEPKFSVLLPSPSNSLLRSVGKQENKVLLKKSSIERLLKEHKEIRNINLFCKMQFMRPLPLWFVKKRKNLTTFLSLKFLIITM